MSGFQRCKEAVGERLLSKKPTPLSTACHELEVAQMDLLRESHASEYHSFMMSMLKSRITRLRNDITFLSYGTVVPADQGRQEIS